MKHKPGSFTRRQAIGAAGICFAMLSEKMLAASANLSDATSASEERMSTYTKDSEATGIVEIAGIHEGKGKVNTKYFRFDESPWPAHFIIYDLPPGASEGVHTHYLDDRNKQGPYDEYYYFISGHGQMDIDGQIVPVTKGDHVHTPLEVAHGVENTHPTENLRVFLTFIKRGDATAPLRAPKP